MGLDQLVAYLRGLPDDWESWLVLADALSEAGDARGELLVLEHQLATTSTPDADVRWYVDELAHEWIAAWGGQLGEEDVDCYSWLRELSPLAARAHADLASTFARPPSQLLALLVPQDARPGVSPVFELQRDRVFAATLAWIDRAFDGVPVPDSDHRTIHQAEAADNYESCDRSRDHLGRWQDLPDEHLLDNQWALAHLDEQGIRYYVPAAMSFALRNRTPHARDFWIAESLEYTLQPSKRELRDHQQERFALFDRDQRAAIYAFTRTRRYTKAAAAWARVFEAERDAERIDWFELYSPRDS